MSFGATMRTKIGGLMSCIRLGTCKKHYPTGLILKHCFCCNIHFFCIRSISICVVFCYVKTCAFTFSIPFVGLDGLCYLNVVVSGHLHFSMIGKLREFHASFTFF